MPISGFVGLLASFLLLLREEHWTIATAACLWLAFAPQFFQTTTQDVLSDLPYFAISSLALLAMHRPKPSLWIPVVLVVAAVLVRSVGVALVGAAAVALAVDWPQLTRRARQSLALATVAGGAAEVVWLRWASMHAVVDWPGDAMNSYLRQLALKDPRQPGVGLATAGDLIWRIRDGAALQTAHATELLTRAPWIDPVWFSPLVLIPFLLIATGIVVTAAAAWTRLPRVRALAPSGNWVTARPSTLLAAYVVMYSAVYALWPFDEGTRFVTPIFPLLFMFGARGMRTMFALVKRDAVRPTAVAAVAALVCVAATWSFVSATHRGLQESLALASCYVILAVAAAACFVNWPGRLVWRPAPLAVATLAVVLFAAAATAGLVGQTRIASANIHPSPTPSDNAKTMSVAGWLLAQPEHDVVMAQQTALLHRLTGRRIVPFPVVPDAAIVANAIQQHDVALLVVGQTPANQYYRPSEQDRFLALSKLDPRCCALVFASGDYRVYRVGATKDAAPELYGGAQ
jgi:hypothetical protein